MSYTPTIWNENDIITAEKLNNLESGIDDLILDLGEVNLTVDEENNRYEQATITLNEDQLSILQNENLIGIRVKLLTNVHEIPVSLNCFLQKVMGMKLDSEGLIYPLFFKQKLEPVVELIPYYLDISAFSGSHMGNSNSTLFIFAEINFEYNFEYLGNSIIDIGNFQGLEDLNGATKVLDINKYLLEDLNVKVRFGISSNYGGGYNSYFLPYLYSDCLALSVISYNYYFGKEEIIEDVLHSYRVVIERRGDVYTSKMIYKTYNLSP